MSDPSSAFAEKCKNCIAFPTFFCSEHTSTQYNTWTCDFPANNLCKYYCIIMGWLRIKRSWIEAIYLLSSAVQVLVTFTDYNCYKLAISDRRTPCWAQRKFQTRRLFRFLREILTNQRQFFISRCLFLANHDVRYIASGIVKAHG